MSQLALVTRRGFAGYFWTQFLGAFNDNVFRNALVILIAFRAWSIGDLDSSAVVALAGGIFIVPFVLLSPIAGRLADATPKARLMRHTKAAEVAIMLTAAVAFVWGGLGSLLVVLFLMGAQSAVFGPVKYGIIPELVDDGELVAANAVVETGTFLAILVGTIVGGLLVGLGEAGPRWVSAATVVAALAGWGASLAIPPRRAASPGLHVGMNPLAPFRTSLDAARAVPSVFVSIFALAWFWFFGSGVVALLPNYTRDVLGGGERVVTLFLALFCVGIALGSLLCGRLSGRHVELGFTPLGAVGMSVFAFDLWLVGAPAPAADPTLETFLASVTGWRIMADLTLLAVAGGLYTVPLYAVMQHRSRAAVRASVIAANNVMGALFMVVSALVMAGLAVAGITIPARFGVLALLNIVAVVAVCATEAEFPARAARLLRRGT